MRKFMRALRGAERGQAMFEVAIFAPLFLAVLIGLIEVGRFAHFAILVANAAHAGAQYGGQNLVTALDTTGMQNAALADAQNVAGVTATAASACQCSDGTASTCGPTVCSANHRLVVVKVTVSGAFTSLFKYPGIPKSLSVTRVATMQVPP
jgi:Flp pilus assembly protein TadG